MEPKLIIVFLLKSYIVQGKKQMLAARWYNFCQWNFCKGDGLFNMLYPGDSVPTLNICPWDLSTDRCFCSEE